jgi:dinuclear metal center YbgI/SA1388 family protein
MRCEEIFRRIENVYPTQAALDFDNVGLLAGRLEREVHTIYIAVDASDEVVEEAIRLGADLLITHHPLIFSPMKRVTDQDFIGRRLVRLIQNDISYYAMHTNYDVRGMADLSARWLGLQQTEALEVTEERIVKRESDHAGNEDSVWIQEGIGRIGQFSEEMSLQMCCERVKQSFALEHVRVFGDLQTGVRRAAICPGSGKSVIDVAIEKGAQVLITGDIGHHEGIDAVARGMAVIDAGHYGVEYIFMSDMKTFLEENVPGVAVTTAKVTHPFQTV